MKIETVDKEAEIPQVNEVNNLFMMTEHKEYSKDGALLSEGNLDKNGLKTGLWKEYYDNGKISAIELFMYGKLHGYYKSFHENGNVWSTGNFNHGRKEGEFEIFNPQGKLILVQHYRDNILISEVNLEK